MKLLIFSLLFTSLVSHAAISVNSNVSGISSGSGGETITATTSVLSPLVSSNNENMIVASGGASNFLTLRGGDAGAADIFTRSNMFIVGGTSGSVVGKLKIKTDGSFGNVFQSPTGMNADLTYTLPTDDGDAGECLTTNGSGVLSWTTCNP